MHHFKFASPPSPFTASCGVGALADGAAVQDDDHDDADGLIAPGDDGNLPEGGDENRVVSGGVRRRKVDSALLYNERALLACAAQLAGWDADDVIVLGGVHVQRQQPRVQEGGKRREQRTNGSHGPQRQEEEQPEREEEEVGGGDSERAKRGACVCAPNIDWN